MSNSGDNGSTSSNNRVDPRFFGSPSLYQPLKKENKSKSVMPPPGAGENPYWIPEDQPPPPYTQSPSESSHPSAPPLEDEEEEGRGDDYSIGNTGGFVRPPQIQQPQSPYTQSYPRYNQYGSVPSQNTCARNNSATGDVSWPWNAPPSATGNFCLGGRPIAILGK